MIRIGIIDKNELFRESIHQLVDFKTSLEVEFSSGSIASCINTLKPGEVDLILIDNQNFSELEKINLKDLIHHFPEIKFVLFSSQISENDIYHFSAKGIRSFLSKESSIVELNSLVVRTIKSSNSFEILMNKSLQISLDQGKNSFLDNREVNLQVFSQRELEVLDLICQEKTNVEIADKLKLSVRTIETHRRRMLEKSGSKSMIGLVLYAVKNRIVDVNKIDLEISITY